MTTQQSDLEKRLFAAAIYQIRLLLASHIGSGDKGPERAAAELAYALHNDALSVLANRPVDVVTSLGKLDRLEALLGGSTLAEMRASVLDNEA
jgi:hypothetical protein